MQQHHNVTPKGTSEFTMMLIAYTRQDAKEFNSYLEAYRKLVDKDLPTETSRAGFEAFFNYFEPFYTCAVLYAVVFVLAFIGFVLWCANAKSGGSQVRQAALALLCLTLIVHTFALFGRMYLMDRPMVFVTNLYSSAIFIGWGCALLGLGLEFVYRMGLGNVVAAVGGFASLLIAQILSASGDTMEMMQAVLDTNFWLSTHVTCVTFGYSATFVAGLLGIVMILLSTFTNLMDRPLTKVLGSMIYGILCFALFFSFVGTVLGGLWADYSWGRFWGWDPKENGALLIVIWNALILHARWCGLVQQRGMAVLAIGGNIITSWSWFGVNMLGIGLHSYASASGANWLAGFAVSQLVLIGIGCLPLRKWPTPQTAKT
jgi:ABC-type transport system involved in cytochrome c biogenesis permease subunit